MRTEAQKRVCEAFGDLVAATVMRDAAAARDLSISDYAEGVVKAAEDNFIASLNAVIDERKGVQS